MNKTFLIIFILLFSYIPAYAFDAKCIGVTDGDTIEVMHNSTPVKVRLSGIDCPEKNQAFGMQAKKFTSNMVFGQVVSVEESGKYTYDRLLGIVSLNGQCLNEELLKNGLAWVYTQYYRAGPWYALENTARTQKIGLWAQDSPVAPWKFRHKKR